MILMVVAMMPKAMARTRAKDKAMAMAMSRIRRRHKMKGPNMARGGVNSLFKNLQTH